MNPSPVQVAGLIFPQGTFLNDDGNPERIRVMTSTCKWTTMLKYQAADFEKGFQRNGCETRFLIEENNVQEMGVPFYFEQLDEFKPDVWFSVSHCRVSYQFLPKQLPVICYMMDKLYPITAIKDLRPYIQPNDLFVCMMNEFQRWLCHKKVPEEQTMVLPPPVDEKVFRPMKEN